MWNVLLIYAQTAAWCKASLSNYTSLFYEGVITYTCHEPQAGLVNLCWEKGPLRTIYININHLGDTIGLLFHEKYQHLSMSEQASFKSSLASLAEIQYAEVIINKH